MMAMRLRCARWWSSVRAPPERQSHYRPGRAATCTTLSSTQRSGAKLRSKTSDTAEDQPGRQCATCRGSVGRSSRPHRACRSHTQIPRRQGYRHALHVNPARARAATKRGERHRWPIMASAGLTPSIPRTLNREQHRPAAPPPWRGSDKRIGDQLHRVIHLVNVLVDITLMNIGRAMAGQHAGERR